MSAEAEAEVVAAANRTILTGDEPIHKDVSAHLQIVGKKVSELVEPGERLVYFVPTFVKLDGRSRPGALALADTRLILGYAESALALTTAYARSVPFVSITSSPTSRQKVSLLAAKSPTVTVNSTELSFAAIFTIEGLNKKLFSAVVGILRGFWKMDWEKGETIDMNGEHVAVPGFTIDTEHPRFQEWSREPSVI